MNVRLASRPEGNNEIKTYYGVCCSFWGSYRAYSIVNHAIQYYLKGKETLYCSERSLIEFFMYLVWLVDDGFSSLHLEVWEYENENDFNEFKEEIDHFFLVHFRTPDGFMTGIRRYLDDGGHTFEELDVEPYEPKYITESWERI